MKIKYLYCLILVCLLSSCYKLDTYDEPQETLTGSVIDITTNKPIITEQPNGFRLKLMEISWSDNPIPLYFLGKADGTFKNTKVFRGTYEITPVEGAFFQPDPQVIDINGTTNVEFEVSPYLSIQVDKMELVNGMLNIQYRISRLKVSEKIIDARVFVSTNPNVGFNTLINELSPMKELKDLDDETVLATSFEEKISGLVKGKTYYVRVGARTNNSSLRYNFTETVEFICK